MSSEFCRDMKARPLFGRSPLFGVSVKREFTVQTVHVISLLNVCRSV